MNDYNNLEMDYPNCSKIFSGLILNWMKINSTEGGNIDIFLNKLKETRSDDDDEMYSIEQFNEKVTCSLLSS